VWYGGSLHRPITESGNESANPPTEQNGNRNEDPPRQAPHERRRGRAGRRRRAGGRGGLLSAGNRRVPGVGVRRDHPQGSHPAVQGRGRVQRRLGATYAAALYLLGSREGMESDIGGSRMVSPSTVAAWMRRKRSSGSLSTMTLRRPSSTPGTPSDCGTCFSSCTSGSDRYRELEERNPRWRRRGSSTTSRCWSSPRLSRRCKSATTSASSPGDPPQRRTSRWTA